MCVYVCFFPQGKLTGLCGNFDLKTVNELRTPDNFELTNSQEFGNSWTAVEVCSKKNVFASILFSATWNNLSRMESEIHSRQYRPGSNANGNDNGSYRSHNPLMRRK